MGQRPEEYLETLLARQADLILEAHWERLLRQARKPRGRRARAIRNYLAARLRWLADRLQVEPDLATATG